MLNTTIDLADAVVDAVGPRRSRGKTSVHAATQTFQALRMVVNNELGELAVAIVQAHDLLRCVVRKGVQTKQRVAVASISEGAGHLECVLALRIIMRVCRVARKLTL